MGGRAGPGPGNRSVVDLVSGAGTINKIDMPMSQPQAFAQFLVHSGLDSCSHAVAIPLKLVKNFKSCGHLAHRCCLEPPVLSQHSASDVFQIQ